MLTNDIETAIKEIENVTYDEFKQVEKFVMDISTICFKNSEKTE